MLSETIIFNIFGTDGFDMEDFKLKSVKFVKLKLLVLLSESRLKWLSTPK